MKRLLIFGEIEGLRLVLDRLLFGARHGAPVQMEEERKLSLRLKNWDYSDDGWYFVTICVRHHEYVFGEIRNDEMVLNNIGKIVQKIWLDIPQHFKNIYLDEFIVMPNHVHGIIVIENNSCRGAPWRARNRKFGGLQKRSLSSVINHFKGTVTRWCNKHECYFQWQRSFHDHIIRNDHALKKIRKYIHFNVEKWEDDLEHPNHFA